jgi:membrane fusion protein (multidrug efflux system)
MNAFPPKRRYGRPLLLLVVLLVGLYLYTKKGTDNAATPVQEEITSLEFLPTDIIRITPQTLRKVLPISGELRAVTQSPVKALVNGEVTEVLVREGETVQAGQIVIRIDPREHQARLAQAKGALLAAQGQLNIATQTRDNNQALLDKGFISRNAFDTAYSQYQIAHANVESAIGARDVAQKAVTDTNIRAPIAGVISSRTVQPGEKVSTDNKLLDIIDLRQMELESAVPASDIMHVALGQEVQVSVEGLSAPIKGTVARINPATQSGSRSILTYIRIDNTQGLLRAGMFAEATLTLDKKDDVLSIPQLALHQENDVQYVYAIDNNTIVRKTVTTGMHGVTSQGPAIEILSGLSNGIAVIKSNLGVLKEGTLVRFAGETPQAATKP